MKGMNILISEIPRQTVFALRTF